MMREVTLYITHPKSSTQYTATSNNYNANQIHKSISQNVYFVSVFHRCREARQLGLFRVNVTRRGSWVLALTLISSLTGTLTCGLTGTLPLTLTGTLKLSLTGVITGVLTSTLTGTFTGVLTGRKVCSQVRSQAREQAGS